MDPSGLIMILINVWHRSVVNSLTVLPAQMETKMETKITILNSLVDGPMVVGGPMMKVGICTISQDTKLDMTTQYLAHSLFLAPTDH